MVARSGSGSPSRGDVPRPVVGVGRCAERADQRDTAGGEDRPAYGVGNAAAAVTSRPRAASWATTAVASQSQAAQPASATSQTWTSTSSKGSPATAPLRIAATEGHQVGQQPGHQGDEPRR